MKARFLIVLLAIALFFDSNAQNQAPNFTLSTPLSGNQVYEATQYIDMINGFNYNATNAQDVFHAKINPFMVFPPEEGELGGPTGYENIVGDDGVVGAMAGNLSINGLGAAVYSIPINIPSSAGGMTPTISLNYNSSGSWGLCGQGWDIGGISKISYTTPNIYYDGKVSALQGGEFLPEYILLDGQRLIKVSSKTADFTDQSKLYTTAFFAEYRKESDDFSKITLDVPGDGSVLFKVQTKSGLLYTYGGNIYNSSSVHRKNTSNGQAIFGFYLSTIEDNYGNIIEFDYYNYPSSGTVIPKSVKYGGRKNYYNSYEYEVLFNYSESGKEIKSHHYHLNSEVHITLKHKLDNITCTHKETNSIVRKYVINYESTGDDVTSHSQIFVKSIQEFGLGGIKYNKTVFEHENNQALSNPVYHSVLHDPTQADFQSVNQGNFTGISNQEFLIENYDPNHNSLLYQVYRSNTRVMSTVSIQNRKPMACLPADYNGDGLVDFISVVIERDNDNPQNIKKYYIMFYKSNGSSFIPQLLKEVSTESHYIIDCFQGDFDGDGIMDFAYRNEHGQIYFFTGSTNGVWGNLSSNIYIDDEYKVITGNFRNFNRTDFFIYGDTTYANGLTIQKRRIMHLSYSVLGGFKREYIDVDLQADDDSEDFVAGDFNGDGKTDIISCRLNADENGLLFNIYHSYGGGFVFKNSKTVLDPDIANGYMTGEFSLQAANFDGNNTTDFFITLDKKKYNGNNTWSLWSNGVMCFLNNPGDNIISKPFIDPSTQELFIVSGRLERFNIFDINFDGASDICIQRNYTKQLHFYRSYPEKRSITKITTGIGLQNIIEYASSNDQTVYTKGTYNEFPVGQLFFPLKLVKSLKTSNGIGGFNTQEYSYSSGLVHKQGKGFLGFEKQTTVNDVNNSVSVVERNLNTTYFILTDQLQTTKIDSKLVNSTEMTFNTKNWGKKNYFLYLEESLSKSYELNGSLISVSRVRNFKEEGGTRIDYDDFGNSLYTITETGSDENSMWYKTWIRNYYNNYTTGGKWILGRLSNSNSSSQSPGEYPIYKHAKFDYYTSGIHNGMLKTEYIMNWDVLVRSKQYTYDDFGNITSSTLAAPGLESRSSFSEYDHNLLLSKGRFLTKTTNALGQAVEQIYDLISGDLRESTDINNHKTTYEYDGFSRKFKTTAANGNINIDALRWVETETPYKPALQAVYYSWHQSSGNMPFIKFYDVLSRVIREVSFGMNETEIIYVDTEYDSKGRIFRQSEPYYSTATEIYYTVYEEYDELGRPKRIKMPETNSYVRYDYFSEDGLTVTKTTNSKMQYFTSKANAIGQLVETKDFYNNKIIKEYYADGQIKTIKNSNNDKTTITYTYDSPLRRLKSMNEPARGLTTYEYNAYDEPTKISHNGYDVIFNQYDKLGRLLRKTEHEGEYTFEYDTRPNGIGMVSKMAGPEHSIEYFYDNLSRNSSNIEKIFDESFTTEFSYDVFGRPDLITYPTSKLTVKNIYNDYGVLIKIVNATNQSILWKLEETDARGNITQQQLADGHMVDMKYYPETGLIHTIVSGDIQNNEYKWDKAGYLEWRKDVKRNLKESFYYDDLNRLRTVYKNSVVALSLAYDNIGNISNKSDVGTYQYSSTDANPYKLVSINNKPPSINSFLQNVEYTSFNKVKYVSEKNEGDIVHELELFYGVNKQRIKQITDKRDTKIFVGSLYEKYVESNVVTEVFYIYSPAGLIAINTITDNSNQLSVVLKDHLGSLQFVVPVNGGTIAEFSYDAWGSRRDPQTWALLQSPVGFKYGVGFTGHEHLELFSIINMNGRIYDPVLGLFFTPDPVLQFPNLPIGLNPYTYCLNSPLSFVDPTGYSIDGAFFTFIRIMAMTVVSIGSGGALLPAMIVAGTFAVMDGMYAMAKGANVNIFVDFVAPVYINLLVTSGIGKGFGANNKVFANELLRASAHGINNGVSRMISGGKFQHGFLSGFVSSLGGSYSPNINGIVNTAMAAALGGTVETIGGGKFSNGAVTGAFVYLLNHMAHETKDPPKGDPEVKEKPKEEIELIGSTAYAKDNQWKVWPLDYEIEAGQHVKIVVKNLNFFGAHIEVSDHTTGSVYSKIFGLFEFTGESFQAVIPPLSSKTFDFYYMGSEKRNWVFHFYSQSDIINVGIKFYGKND